MFIRVVPYDPFWEVEYENESQKIKNILKDILVEVYHIGSTAVKGLAAKSIIDIMTIRELEMLLYLHHNDKIKEKQILNRLLDSIKLDGLHKNIGAIYEELSIHENPHLDGKMDYFSKMMKHFENNLQ